MRMRRLGPFLAGALLAGALAAPLAAQMPEGPPGKWWKRPRIVGLLNLTADQQNRLEEIFSRNRRAFVDLKADVERKQIDVEELLTKKDADEKKTAAAIDALEQARLRLRRQVAMMFLEQKEVLTAAQWQTVLDKRDEWRRERIEERRMRRGDRGDGGGPGGPGGPGPRRPQRGDDPGE